LVIVKTKCGSSRDPSHNQAIQLLITLLNRAAVQQINYDHIETTIPRAKVSLKHKKETYDIAYITQANAYSSKSKCHATEHTPPFISTAKLL